MTYFIVNLLVHLRRLAASEKFVRDAQTPGSAEDFQIVKLLLYLKESALFLMKGRGNFFWRHNYEHNS